MNFNLKQNEMKKQFFMAVASVLIFAAVFTNIKLNQDNDHLNLTLSDIAVMAKADTESSDPCPGWDGSSYCQWVQDEGMCLIKKHCGISCPGGC